MFQKATFHRLKDFWERHPTLRQACWWTLPAILIGLVLRVCLLSYNPLAYWGSDSRSYFDFAYKLYVHRYISLVEKRRFLYPIYLGLVTFLPGTPLRWVALLQHGFGLLTLLPIGYVIRKCLVAWRLWIAPITILYAGMPVLFWYEHEVLGETMLFSAIAWALAGWVAWDKESRTTRAQRLWWLFLLPFAVAILTKPSARFFWPGLGVGLLYTQAWRKISWTGIAATLALMVVTLLVGSKKQGAWLFYTATFPLTQLSTPKHAEYKAEIADKVREYRAQLDHYFHEDGWAFSFLENPSKQTERPLWNKLEGQLAIKAPLYMDLAKEAMWAEPLQFFRLGLERMVASANLSSFKELRFTSGYFPERFEDDYRQSEMALQAGSTRGTYEALALGLPVRGPFPPYEEIVKQIAPRRDSLAERIVTGWVRAYEAVSDLVRWPAKKERDLVVAEARPSALGCYFVLALLMALAPQYRSSLGFWMLAALGYVFGVFLVSQVNPRYFGASWPVFIPLLALPMDLVAALRRRREPVEAAGTAATL